jgi:hypothetical protein
MIASDDRYFERLPALFDANQFQVRQALPKIALTAALTRSALSSVLIVVVIVLLLLKFTVAIAVNFNLINRFPVVVEVLDQHSANHLNHCPSIYDFGNLE